MSMMLAHRYTKGDRCAQMTRLSVSTWTQPENSNGDIHKARKNMVISRRQRLFTIIVLRHLCFKTTLQILPESGADDGMLWNNLPTPLLWGAFVGWLFTHNFYQNVHPWQMSREINSKTAMEGIMQTSVLKSETVYTTLPLYSGDVYLFQV